MRGRNCTMEGELRRRMGDVRKDTPKQGKVPGRNKKARQHAAGRRSLVTQGPCELRGAGGKGVHVKKTGKEAVWRKEGGKNR